MIRPGQDFVLHYGGKLFQQWCVDQYAKVEFNRLNYFRMNQKKIRVDLYIGLQDAVDNGEEHIGGRLVILPSSFVGGPRYMAQSYQDAMAIVREYGKPDLFITFTCNPAWIEITRELFPNQLSSDRPDLVCRVFNVKLKELINDFQSGSAFGRVLAFIYVVEFQKRGLPHAHILLILENKISPDDYDKYVSAEIPHQNTQSDLYEIVTRHMVHNCIPSRCFGDNGTCSKHFPKAFASSTTTNENDGYPCYRRRSPREGGRVAQIQGNHFSHFKHIF